MDWGGCPIKFWIWSGMDLDPASWGGLELGLKIWSVKTSREHPHSSSLTATLLSGEGAGEGRGGQGMGGVDCGLWSLWRWLWGLRSGNDVHIEGAWWQSCFCFHCRYHLLHFNGIVAQWRIQGSLGSNDPPQENVIFPVPNETKSIQLFKERFVFKRFNPRPVGVRNVPILLPKIFPKLKQITTRNLPDRSGQQLHTLAPFT